MLLLERKVEIITRLLEWRKENERPGGLPRIFLILGRLSKVWIDCEPMHQDGSGEKISAIEVVRAGTSTADEDSENNFTVTKVQQVKVKKFWTTGMDCTVQFTDTKYLT